MTKTEIKQLIETANDKFTSTAEFGDIHLEAFSDLRTALVNLVDKLED
jgi:hypothetical protein